MKTTELEAWANAQLVEALRLYDAGAPDEQMQAIVDEIVHRTRDVRFGFKDLFTSPIRFYLADSVRELLTKLRQAATPEAIADHADLASQCDDARLLAVMHELAHERTRTPPGIWEAAKWMWQPFEQEMLRRATGFLARGDNGTSTRRLQ